MGQLASTSLCQGKYCLDLINEYGLLNSKPVSTPLDSSIKLYQDAGQNYANVSSYI